MKVKLGDLWLIGVAGGSVKEQLRVHLMCLGHGEALSRALSTELHAPLNSVALTCIMLKETEWFPPKRRTLSQEICVQVLVVALLAV